jgi:hypothetical protein
VGSGRYRTRSPHERLRDAGPGCRFAHPGYATATVVGQNRSGAESSRDVRREWSDLAKGRTEFEVSDPTLVSSQLALAVEQSGCRHYEELIKGIPFVSLSLKTDDLQSFFVLWGWRTIHINYSI